MNATPPSQTPSGDHPVSAKAQAGKFNPHKITIGAALLSAAALITLFAFNLNNCGGGGGRTTAPATPDSLLPGFGQAVFTIDFPPQTQPRQGSVLPSALQKVTVSLHAVKDGKEIETPQDAKTAIRPSSGGGRVTLTFGFIPFGRYHTRIGGFDVQGALLVQNNEPVNIEAGKTTVLPATMGLVHGPTGFFPAQLTLATGESLVVRQTGFMPGYFHLDGLTGCSAFLEKSGVLACTPSAPGVFVLMSPDGHSATVTVVSDSARLQASKPSLGLKRAEGFIGKGKSFEALFTVHGVSDAQAHGLMLDPGGDMPQVPVTGPMVSVSYNKPGAFIATLKSSGGEVLTQRLVNVYHLPEPPSPPVITCAGIPDTVSQAVLTISGSVSPGAQALLSSASGSVILSPDATGHFTLDVTLLPGPNFLSAQALDAEGHPGPLVSTTVAYQPAAPPGDLASITLTGLPQHFTAGQSFTVQYQGYDQHGQPAVFGAQVEITGVTVTQQGPAQFTLISTGNAMILVRDLLTGVSATAAVPVEPGPLVSLRVIPGNVTLRSGQTVTFTAEGMDAFGNPIANPSVTWTATGGLSGLDPVSGRFQPPARGYGAVRAVSGAVKADACVSVNPEAPPL